MSSFLKNMYTDSQLKDLATLGAIGLSFGAIPIFKNILFRKDPVPVGANVYGSQIKVPVIDESVSELDNKFAPKNKKEKFEEVERFNPAKGSTILKEKNKEGAEKKGFTLGDITNPYFIPGTMLALGVPYFAASAISDKLFGPKAEKKRDIDASKEYLAKAMIEAQLKNKEDNKGEIKQAEAQEFIDNLEKLASIYVNKESLEKTAVGGAIGSQGLSTFNTNAPVVANNPSGDVYAHRGDQGENIVWKTIRAVAKEISEKLGKPYLGILTGLGLAGLGAGVYTGFKKQKEVDPEALLAHQYTNQFLKRQQQQGLPVYATPYSVPVSYKSKDSK